MNRKRTEVELKLRRELTEIKERRKESLLRRKGIEGIGVGEKEIVVIARRGVPVESEIEGRPVRVIRTEKIRVLLKEERVKPQTYVTALGITARGILGGYQREIHAPFLPPVSGARIGQEWGVLKKDYIEGFAGAVLTEKFAEMAHTLYANGDYSIKGYDVLGPSDGMISLGGCAGGCAGITLKITEGVAKAGNLHIGKQLGAATQTTTWKKDWNRFIFDTPIPVKRGHSYLLWLKAKKPMPPYGRQGEMRGYAISTSKQGGYCAREVKGLGWSFDQMNVILREWVVSVEGTLCMDCATQAECESNGCVWRGPFTGGETWWRYPCQSFLKPCVLRTTQEECKKNPECYWTKGTCLTSGGQEPCPPKTGRLKKWRPAPPGVAMGNVTAPGWGTFTAVVLKNGVKKILGCRHVLAYKNAPLNSTIVQPWDPNEKIGTLEHYIPFEASPASNEVDCAIAKVDNQGDVVPGVLLNDDAYSPSIIPTGVGDAYVDQSVVMSGARTGVVSGRVVSIETTIETLTELGGGRYEGCIVTTTMGDQGDSGAILLDESSKEAVGMLFSGSDTVTVHIPMKKTLSALGCTLYTTGAPPPKKSFITFKSVPIGAGIWLKKI